jgi:hypothetical protein
MIQPIQQPTQSEQDKKDRNKQRGTGFTNINRVLGANVGAGEKMGQKIGEGLSSQAGDIRAGIEAGKSKFQAGMQQGAAGAQSAIQQGQQYGQQVSGQQDQFAQLDPNQLKEQGQALRSAAYKGPQGIEAAGKLGSQAATASALGRLGATAGGQQQLLASQVAQRGGYGTGQSALDRALIGRSGQQQIQQGRSALSGIEAQTQGALQGAQSQAAAKAAGIEAQRAKTIQDLRSKLSGDTGLLSVAKQQASEYNKAGSKIQQMLAGKNPDGTTIDANNPSKWGEQDVALLDQLEQYGINPEQGIYGKNMDEYGNILSDLSSNIDISQTGGRFMGSQSGAAQNLATLLGDEAAAKQVAENQFNEKLFNPVQQQEAMRRNQEMRTQDLAQQSKLSELSREAQGLLGVRQGTQSGFSDTDIKLSGGGKYGGMNLAQARDQIVAQLTPQEQAVVRSMPTLAQGLDYAQSAIAGRARQAVGQDQSVAELARKRLGLPLQASLPKSKEIPGMVVPKKEPAEEKPVQPKKKSQ